MEAKRTTSARSTTTTTHAHTIQFQTRGGRAGHASSASKRKRRGVVWGTGDGFWSDCPQKVARRAHLVSHGGTPFLQRQANSRRRRCSGCSAHARDRTVSSIDDMGGRRAQWEEDAPVSHDFSSPSTCTSQTLFIVITPVRAEMNRPKKEHFSHFAKKTKRRPVEREFRVPRVVLVCHVKNAAERE